MKKPPTQEQLIKALEIIETKHYGAIKDDATIIQLVLKEQLNCMVSRSFGEAGEIDQARLNLELSYQGVERLTVNGVREGLEAIHRGDKKKSRNIIDVRDRLEVNLRRYWRRRNAVFALQIKYNISSLVENKTVLSAGKVEIKHLWKHELFSFFMPSDVPKLSKSKNDLADSWGEYAFVNGLDIYLYNHSMNEWMLILNHKEDRPSHLFWQSWNTALLATSWCEIWENIHYTSPSRMKAQGYDDCRGNPVYPDDVKHWMVYLRLGVSLDPEIESMEQLFCAANCRPN